MHHAATATALSDTRQSQIGLHSQSKLQNLPADTHKEYELICINLLPYATRKYHWRNSSDNEKMCLIL